MLLSGMNFLIFLNFDHLKSSHPKYLPHNQVQLVRGGREYFELLLRLIDEAQYSIHLQTYIFDSDETGNTVSDALINAAGRGVKVYILVDSFGSQHLHPDAIQRFKGSGIFIRKFQAFLKTKKFYLGRRLHHKVVVVDAYKCTVGGINISNRYNDTDESPAWLDWALYVEGEVGPALEDICKTRLRLRYKTDHDVPKTRFQCNVRISVNDWVRRKRQIYASYLEMIRNSKTEIIIMSAYFLPGRNFRKYLAAAIKRGVKVTVILTGATDVFLMKYAERFMYRWLFNHQVTVYEYRKTILHAKLALCDDNWMTVGSFNINNLSAFASVELNLDVQNESCVCEAKKKIQKVIEEECTLVTETKFVKKYNSFHRTVHKLSYQMFRFLFFLSTRQPGDR
jgi:cardiolipin synthase